MPAFHRRFAGVRWLKTMALGTLRSSGRLRPLQREPTRRGEATGLLGRGVLWLEARRLELELVAMAAEGGRRDPERRGELELGNG